MFKKERDTQGIDEIRHLSTHIDGKYHRYAHVIERLSKHKDTFVRQELAVLLSEHINDHSIGVLKSLACDKDYLVQVEALDSLMGISAAGVKSIIIQCMDSIHPLVRGYAYRCLSELDEETSAIRQQLQMVKEKSTWARIELYISEARVGDPTRIQRLLKMYPKCNYLNRCAISNGITDIFPVLSQSDQGLVNCFVDIHKSDNSSVAEKEALMRLLEMCKEVVESEQGSKTN